MTMIVEHGRVGFCPGCDSDPTVTTHKCVDAGRGAKGFCLCAPCGDAERVEEQAGELAALTLKLQRMRHVVAALAARAGGQLTVAMDELHEIVGARVDVAADDEAVRVVIADLVRREERS